MINKLKTKNYHSLVQSLIEWPPCEVFRVINRFERRWWTVYLCSYRSEADHSPSITHHLLSFIPLFLSLHYCLPSLSNHYHVGYPCHTASSQECVCVCVHVYFHGVLQRVFECRLLKQVFCGVIVCGVAGQTSLLTVGLCVGIEVCGCLHVKGDLCAEA